MRGPVTYGPLYVEDSELDDGADQDVSPSPSYIVGSCRRRLYRHRHVYVTALFLFCVVVTAALALMEKFHLSFPNLLITVFGVAGGKGLSPADSLCLPRQIMDSSRNASTAIMKAPKISVGDLKLTSKATAFRKSLVDGEGDIISTGFSWNEIDADTSKWRPQGVTTYSTKSLDARRFALVSWYGRKDEGYSDLGGRISFVDITDMRYSDDAASVSGGVPPPSSFGDGPVHGPVSTEYLYTHVLLVDENFCTIPDIHVGGIEQKDGILYVADSRKGVNSILGFDIGNELYELTSPEMMRSRAGYYQYVLRQSTSFHSPTKPSFLSYNTEDGQFLVGTYARCGGKVGIHVDTEKCLRQTDNRLVWFDSDVDMDSGQVDNNATSCEFFSEMQGAASVNVGNGTILWVSSSYGPVAQSHLHVVQMPTDGECPDIIEMISGMPIFRLPPGLEDLHIEQQIDGSHHLWMNTEFGTRMIFANKIDDLLGT